MRLSHPEPREDMGRILKRRGYGSGNLERQFLEKEGLTSKFLEEGLKELHRVLPVVSRRTENNPVIIGELRVGKIAIIEGLACWIVRGDVPAR